MISRKSLSFYCTISFIGAQYFGNFYVFLRISWGGTNKHLIQKNYTLERVFTQDCGESPLDARPLGHLPIGERSR